MRRPRLFIMTGVSAKPDVCANRRAMLHTGNGVARQDAKGAGDASLQARRAVETARLVQPEWAFRSLEDRAAALERAAKRMLRDRQTILHLVREEMGKHEVEGLFTEALGPLDAVKGWKKIVARASSKRVFLNPLAFPKKRARITMAPRGVVGIIAPWNFPVAGLYRSVIPALLLGNAV